MPESAERHRSGSLRGINSLCIWHRFWRDARILDADLSIEMDTISEAIDFHGKSKPAISPTVRFLSVTICMVLVMDPGRPSRIHPDDTQENSSSLQPFGGIVFRTVFD